MEYEKLTENQQVVLLNLNYAIDTIIDRGMVKSEDFHITVAGLLNKSLEILNSYEKGRDLHKSDRIFIVYKNHYDDWKFVSGRNETACDIHDALKQEKLITDSLGDLNSEATGITGKILMEKLEVFNQFTGYVMITSSSFTEFHHYFIRQIALKIDTDIYQHNRLKLEQIKNNSIEEIKKIFDSNSSLEIKYNRVIEKIVKTVDAETGILVIPKGGELTIVSSYPPMAPSNGDIPLPFIDLARRAIEQGQSYPLTDISCESSMNCLFQTLLKSREGFIDGVLFIVHRNLTPGRKDVASVLSGTLDSSLLMNHIYANAFNSFMDALGCILDTFDACNTGHAIRVSFFAREAGRILNLSTFEITKLRIASLLHEFDRFSTANSRKPNALSCDLTGFQGLSKGRAMDFFQDIMPFEVFNLTVAGFGSPGYGNSDIPLFMQIITAVDTVDDLASRRGTMDGLSKDEIVASLNDLLKEKVSESIIDAVISNYFWDRIYKVFQELKISMLMEWYIKAMIPDINSEMLQLEMAKKGLEDVYHIRKRYENGRSIDFEYLKESRLQPSDKDLLVQKETQKDKESFLATINRIQIRYRDLLKETDARSTFENQFREKFWDGRIIKDIESDLLRIISLGYDLYADFSNIEVTAVDNVSTMAGKTIMETVKIMLQHSLKQKALNKKYQVHQQELLYFLHNIK